MSVTVYCCGGAGANIGKQITDLDVVVNFVDTSTSNLSGHTGPTVFLVDGMDGAGKNRRTTHENFKDIAGDVLVKLRPSDQLNIVISSLTGGSGSIVGPMVTKELVEAGHNVVVIGVNGGQSTTELQNAINTLMSYKGISAKIQKSVSMYYIENQSRTEADREAIRVINLLALLTDKRHTEEFDNSDLKSFLRFETLTDNGPSMAMLEVMPNEEIVPEKGTAVVGTILITKNKGAVISPVIPEYLSTCVVTDKNYTNDDIRFNSVLGRVALIIEHLSNAMKTFQDNKKVNKVRDIQVTGTTDEGMVI